MILQWVWKSGGNPNATFDQICFDYVIDRIRFAPALGLSFCVVHILME